jgi:DNA-binding MarR family transcriptional regulator
MGDGVGHLARRREVDLATVRPWGFITSHAEVLLALVRDPRASVIELAEAANITTRSAYRILADLQSAGYVTRGKNGRRNRYEVNSALPLGDPPVEDAPIVKLLGLLGPRELDGT